MSETALKRRTTMEKGGKRVGSTLLIITLLIPLGTPACSYPKDRWRAFTEEVKHKAAQPRTKEGKCQRRGGILYAEQCYAPSPSELISDKATCNLRGGLYIDDQCLFALREGEGR